MAVSQAIVSLIEDGLANFYFVELLFYQFVPTQTGVPPLTKTLFASYVGELTSASQNETSVTVQIGSSLDPVEAQASPRKFTTTLVGEPPKI